MSTTERTQARVAKPGNPEAGEGPTGLFARIGHWTGLHLRPVLVVWLMVLVVFGVFAPKVESALAGAGWQDSTSQSVHARQLIRRDFSGLGSSALQVVVVDRSGPIAADPAAIATLSKVEATLRANKDVSTVVPPQAGSSISADGRTAVVIAGAAASTNQMVTAADHLATPLSRLGHSHISVTLTGDSALWANFNSANHSAMLRSEMLSWPVTLAILAVAFGSLIAAGLPLMLTMAGLLVAAGALVLANHIAPVSIWALNFALMFSLALGIDYALFLVVRFRSALEHRGVQPGDRGAAAAAAAETLATAGKAVAFSAVTVLASLASILIVPSPAFRSMAIGIMLSVLAVLAATLTLLPAVLGKLGTRINSGRVRLRRGGPDLPAGHKLEQRLHAWGRLLWAHPWPAAVAGLVVLLLAAAPVIGLRTSMPSITIIPASSNARVGYNQVSAAYGVGFPGTLQVVVPAGEQAAALAAARRTPGVAAVMPGPTNAGSTMDQVVPTTGPSAAATGATIDRLRRNLPPGALVGGAAAENHDLQHALASRTPIVFGMLAAMGFILLLVALGAPLVAFGGVVITGLSVAGAFGIARLIFQNGDLSGLLGFTPQGFVDAWGPLFFGAMVFGVAMDYTLFLLSAAKERYETHADPEKSMVGSVQTSGRVVVSAAAVMIAVFLTFALSGPLAPKEMGVILAVAVALDALVVRLVLLPVLLRLTHHAAWHQPHWLGRILPTVRFAH
ncbi:MMPL family transporter [Acidiferrimicrobium sp. IK]|uniref:MMPL family transporter n=1 Tax=Acidiferrimicrobium sp. IK TaxID=2871700 RepID=UPI0021CB00A9|nr:MMPL family transporter [Acidiferrimicrobium sp. IK]MCU4185145.1 MMPL family transporter [Acidiferrimicrobium sp. IK]